MVRDLLSELGATQPIVLTDERLLAAEAMQLLMRVDRDLLEAWAARPESVRPKPAQPRKEAHHRALPLLSGDGRLRPSEPSEPRD